MLFSVIFDTYDEDKSGHISIQELTKVYAACAATQLDLSPIDPIAAHLAWAAVAAQVIFSVASEEERRRLEDSGEVAVLGLGCVKLNMHALAPTRICSLFTDELLKMFEAIDLDHNNQISFEVGC